MEDKCCVCGETSPKVAYFPVRGTADLVCEKHVRPAKTSDFAYGDSYERDK